MSANYNNKQELVKILSDVNCEMYKNNKIDKIEYKKNTKILIKTIQGRLRLSEKQIALVGMTVQHKLCVTKLRLCISMLQINFN